MICEEHSILEWPQGGHFTSPAKRERSSGADGRVREHPLSVDGVPLYLTGDWLAHPSRFARRPLPACSGRGESCRRNCARLPVFQTVRCSRPRWLASQPFQGRRQRHRFDDGQRERQPMFQERLGCDQFAGEVPRLIQARVL